MRQTRQNTLGLSLAVFVKASCHGSDNRASVDAFRRGQGRYAGVAMIEDATSDHELVSGAERLSAVGAPSYPDLIACSRALAAAGPHPHTLGYGPTASQRRPDARRR